MIGDFDETSAVCFVVEWEGGGSGFFRY